MKTQINNTNKLTFNPRSLLSAKFIPLFVLILLIVVASILSPFFFSGANFENLLLQMAVMIIISCGMFFVILSGGIDLSVGSIAGVSGVFAAGLMPAIGWVNSSIVAIIMGLLLGTINGLLISQLKIAPFITTLGMMNFARGVAYWYTGAQTILWTQFQNIKTDVFKEIGGGLLFGLLPIPALIWVFIFLGTVFLVKKTKFGRVSYAIGGNEEATRLSGINTKLYKVIPYAYCGLLSGLGGVVLTARLGVGSPASGVGLEMDCITAVVIGGTSLAGGKGHISGILIGAFILGIINNLLNLMNVPSYPQQMLKGAIIVLAVILSSLENKKTFKKKI